MKKKQLVILSIEIICLLGLAFFGWRMIDAKIEARKEQERIEAEQREREEEERRLAEEEAARQKKLEELSQWNLILVNNQNAIPDDYEVETVEVENGYLVDARIKEALQSMLADCREAGYSPQIISSFRTRATQQYLYDRTANKADTAVPGHSEHECGLAIDIIDSSSAGWADPLIDKQEELPAQKWLMENCQNYGFILRYPKDKEEITEIIYEPWHYRYVGEEHAKEIMEKGICLEEYIEQYSS